MQLYIYLTIDGYAIMHLSLSVRQLLYICMVINTLYLVKFSTSWQTKLQSLVGEMWNSSQTLLPPWISSQESFALSISSTVQTNQLKINRPGLKRRDRDWDRGPEAGS